MKRYETFPPRLYSELGWTWGVQVIYTGKFFGKTLKRFPTDMDHTRSYLILKFIKMFIVDLERSIRPGLGSERPASG